MISRIRTDTAQQSELKNVDSKRSALPCKKSLNYSHTHNGRKAQ